MKILVATITFTVTVGMLFIFDTRETTNTAEKNYAQILEGLGATENPTATPKTLAKKSASKTPSAPLNTAVLVTSIPRLTATPTKTNDPVTPAVTPTQTPTPVFTPIPSPTGEPTFTPSPQSTGYQIEVVSIVPAPPIKQNSTVQINIKTAPEAQCGIKVTLPSGGQSTAKGLEPKTADTAGNITWSWRINWNTKPGTAMIEINCAKDNQNFSKIFQMEITE